MANVIEKSIDLGAMCGKSYPCNVIELYSVEMVYVTIKILSLCLVQWYILKKIIYKFWVRWYIVVIILWMIFWLFAFSVYACTPMWCKDTLFNVIISWIEWLVIITSIPIISTIHYLKYKKSLKS